MAVATDKGRYVAVATDSGRYVAVATESGRYVEVASAVVKYPDKSWSPVLVPDKLEADTVLEKTADWFEFKVRAVTRVALPVGVVKKINFPGILFVPGVPADTPIIDAADM